MIYHDIFCTHILRLKRATASARVKQHSQVLIFTSTRMCILKLAYLFNSVSFSQLRMSFAAEKFRSHYLPSRKLDSKLVTCSVNCPSGVLRPPEFVQKKQSVTLTNSVNPGEGEGELSATTSMLILKTSCPLTNPIFAWYPKQQSFNGCLVKHQLVM